MWSDLGKQNIKTENVYTGPFITRQLLTTNQFLELKD